MARYEERLQAYQSVDFDDLIGMPLKLLPTFPKCAPSGRPRWATSWWTNTRTPTPRSTKCSRPWPASAPLHRRGRRRPVDLRLARRHARQPEEAAGRLPDAEGHQAGAELPLHQRHPARGQQRDRPQPQAVSQDAVLANWAKASRCAWSMPTTSCTRPSAPWRASSLRAGELRKAQYKEFRDFAILYRANHQARIFEQALRKAQIPYKVSGGQSFFDRAEIKDLCGWFRLWVNNDDDPAFPARHHHAQARHRPHHAGKPGHLREPVQAEPVRGAVQSVAAQRDAQAHARQPARVRPLHQRPGIPRAPHHGRRTIRAPSCSNG
jgi:ATP-dependent DNA helicase Rep